MSKRLLSLVCLFFWTWIMFAGHVSLAQQRQVDVEGTTIDCIYPNGQLVMWYSDPTLNDVGHTYPDGIHYNPNVLGRMSKDLHLFWMGHECGHAHLQSSNESAADCWSAQTGVSQGWFDADDADQLARDMQNNPGDNSHRPGPDRVAHVRACMQQASSSGNTSSRQGHGGGQSSGPPLPPGMVRGFPPEKSPKVAKDPTPKNRDSKTLCSSLKAMAAASADGFDSINKGRRTPASAFTSLQLPMAKECIIQTTSRPTYICEFPKSFASTLIDGTAACFPNTRDSGRDVISTFRLQSPGERPYIQIFDSDDLRLKMSSTK